jgi:putative DNA methylase
MQFIPARESPPAAIRSRGELPHLYKPGGTYFVTFRLADAVLPPTSKATAPRRGMEVSSGWDDVDPEELLAAHDPPITLGSCLLRDRRIASVTRQAMLHFHQNRYELLAWCVMPNHVHSVLTPLDGYTPDAILHSWKSFTAHEANRLLGRRGAFWERESFDHLVRSIESLERFIRYTEQNPVVAGLCVRPEDREFSSARRSLLRVR